MTRRDQRNASWPTKQGATAWAKLNRSSLNLTRIASRSPLSVSITERASLPSINTTATSPGVIHFHERVFDARPHFYERLFRDFRTFMSEFETKRPGLTITPVKCSQHLTGAENGIPITGRREGTRLCRCGAQTQNPPARRLGALLRAWAPGPRLPMAAVLTTISVEAVKTPVIRKSHSSETPSKPS